MEIVALSANSVRGSSQEPAGGCALRGGDNQPGPAPDAYTLIPSWQTELRLAIRDAAELLAALELPDSLLKPAQRAAQPFRVFAPRPYVQRMAKGDPADPLLRQVLPLGEELCDAPGFGTDPVGDEASRLMPGVLHKYHGRALLVVTGACAVHCRYCFRRHYPYAEAPKSPADWQPVCERLAADPTIDEVILSGGDPLTLVDSHLVELTRRIAEVKHIQRLRIHTRLPIVIPERVTDALLTWLTGTRLTPIVVVHANHPHEFDEPTSAALAKLVNAGIPVLNQAVLLRGVNDNVPALAELSRRLVDRRVMPYYLHQLDRVSGAAHFEVPIDRGLELIAALRKQLPGYAVPRYVQEVPGEPHKRVLA